MAVRELFVGEVLHEVELGTFRNLGYTVRQTALIGRKDGDIELWVEVLSKRFMPLAVHYVHLPAGGHAELEAVARRLIDEPIQPGRSAGERLAGFVLQLGRLPLLAVFLGFIGFWLFMVLSIVTGGFFGQITFQEPSPVWLLAYGIGLVGAFALHWGSLWFVCKALGEPFAASMTRMLVGHPRDIRDMGVGKGPPRRRHLPLSRVHTLAMAAYGRQPWLVVTRSFRTFLSANVRLWRFPPQHIPSLLEALTAYRTQTAQKNTQS
jgi:hypothetical protein